MKVYVLFNLSGESGSAHRTRSPVPAAVVTVEPAGHNDYSFAYVAVELYKNREHQKIAGDIAKISADRYGALKLTGDLIKTKLSEAFGDAVIYNGCHSGLYGKTVYVTMSSPPNPDHALNVMMDKEPGAKAVPVKVYRYCVEVHCAQNAQARLAAEAKASLLPETRKVLGLE